MKKRIFKYIGPIFGLIIFSIAIYFLYKELKSYSFKDIVSRFKLFSYNKIFLASLFTIISYFILTFYDTFAFFYIKKKLSYSKIAFVSLVSYIFSNNIGFAAFSGSAVRFRFYNALKISSIDIVKIITFCFTTFWIGLFISGSVAFIFEPIAIPSILHLPLNSIQPVGIIMFLLVIAYLLFCIFKKKPIIIKEWEFAFPNWKLSVFQIFISFIDWIISGLVLYVLLPADINISYPVFFSIFMLAQIAGLVSNVPGGLGVFETIMIVILSNISNPNEIITSLFFYRLIYYFIPFIIGIILFIINEILLNKEKSLKIFRAFVKIFPQVFPVILSIITFFGGIVLLISGASPSVSLRMKWLDIIFPLHVMEISHFFASLSGIGLLILSFGIVKRLDASYYLTIIALCLGIVFSLLKGLDYEEAIVLFIILLLFLPCHKIFYRKASLFSTRFSLGWFFSVIIVILCSIWIGLFFYKHIDYTNELWWQFELSNDASRFLRATLGITIFLLFLFIYKLLKPKPPRKVKICEDDTKEIHDIVLKSNNISSNLALLGDKYFLFSDNKTAFIMYGISGSSWIAMGDPVGNKAGITELIWQFKEMSDVYDGFTVFYEVGNDNLNLYIELGLSIIKIGEEAKVLLNDFSLEGKIYKDFRYVLNKLQKDGYSFEIIERENVPGFMKEFNDISDVWLKTKNVKEKGFSLGFFNEEYMKKFPAGIVRDSKGKIVAFSNVWILESKDEYSIDLMRYIPDSPNGVMDFLFTNLLIWGKNQGYKWFNIGMSPLSGLSDRPLAPLWNKIGSIAFGYGENFYNFQGLRNYKAKYNPQWFPKYLAYSGGIFLPKILAGCASLIGGGLKGIITK